MSALAPVSPGHAPQSLPADAAGLLYERHSRRIFGYCLSLLGSREDAEDAVQTTFINAQRGLGRGVVPQFELAWLFKIARNVCYNARESSSRRGRVESVRDLDALQDVLAMPDRGASVALGELTRALGAIPERQRRALLLREFQGLSYEEIAAELGVSVAAVETLIFRARRAVADQLEQTGTSRFGAIAALFTPIRWLFQGGAAPLKLAAAGAAVATTATLAVVPAVREHPPAPTPVSPQVATLTTPVRAAEAPHRVVRPVAAPPTKTRASVEDVTTPTATSAPAPPAREEAVVTATAPKVSVPNATVPDVTTPESGLTVPEIPLPQVELPAVKLPAVELPAVELPAVELPPVELPKLP